MAADERAKRLKVAIIGGGPGGLAAAIEMSRLPFVDWTLYEKKPCISETGGGISLQPHTWRLLEHNGAAASINPVDFFGTVDGQIEQRRSNGRNGQLLVEKYSPDDVPLHRRTCRLVRAKLQAALLQRVDQTHVRVAKRLVGIEQLPNRQVRISFDDGFVDEVDFLLGADGIRSVRRPGPDRITRGRKADVGMNQVVRTFSFPHHTRHPNGRFVYRTIVDKSDADKIGGIPWAPTFWKHVSGLYVFTSPLGNEDFEVTVRLYRPHGAGQEHVSWGRPFDLRTILHEFDDFCLPVRRILRLAADSERETHEFALLSGPRLQRIVSHGNIAVIGDASHSMLGNFGSGAGFALEDAYSLARTIDWAWSREKTLADALSLFDSVRSPHYERLYRVLDEFAAIKAAVQAEGLSIDDEIQERVDRISLASESWMYYYEIERATDEALREADKSGKYV